MKTSWLPPPESWNDYLPSSTARALSRPREGALTRWRCCSIRPALGATASESAGSVPEHQFAEAISNAVTVAQARGATCQLIDAPAGTSSSWLLLTLSAWCAAVVASSR